MASRYYKITTETGRTFYAEVPEGKKLKTTLDGQLKIWYENIEGSKYRGRGIEASKIKEIPAKGVSWLSIYPTFLDNKPAPRKPKTLVV